MIKAVSILRKSDLNKNKMLKVVFCGYREWAVDIIKSVSNHPKIEVINFIKSYEEYKSSVNFFPDDIDMIIFLGWSWIIPPEVTDKYLCLGIHPSDLPEYRGGSPIQNQILDGIERTKVTLMTLSSEKLDAGEVWMKEDLDLRGDLIDHIFKNISQSSIKLLNRFFDVFPDLKPEKQNISKGSYFKRRKPEQSLLTADDLKNKSLKELYNFIRCLSDPYPNAYMEDSQGNRLLFKHVEYVPSESKDPDKLS